jgi:hypothetical protein
VSVRGTAIATESRNATAIGTETGAGELRPLTAAQQELYDRLVAYIHADPDRYFNRQSPATTAADLRVPVEELEALFR